MFGRKSAAAGCVAADVESNDVDSPISRNFSMIKFAIPNVETSDVQNVSQLKAGDVCPAYRKVGSKISRVLLTIAVLTIRIITTSAADASHCLHWSDQSEQFVRLPACEVWRAISAH